jgi:hypothetical protein
LTTILLEGVLRSDFGGVDGRVQAFGATKQHGDLPFPGTLFLLYERNRLPVGSTTEAKSNYRSRFLRRRKLARVAKKGGTGANCLA